MSKYDNEIMFKVSVDTTYALTNLERRILEFKGLNNPNTKKPYDIDDRFINLINAVERIRIDLKEDFQNLNNHLENN